MLKVFLKHPYIYSIAIVCLICMIVAGILIYRHNNQFVTTYYEVKHATIGTEFDGYKIAQISDFHNVGYNGTYDDIVAKLKEEQPDMIALTGDFIDRRTTDYTLAFDFAKELVQIAPTYFVMGNHEGAAKELDTVLQQLFDVGVVLLQDNSVLIARGEDHMVIAGISDPVCDKEITTDSRIQQALQYNVENYPTILLSHRPELFDVYYKYDITLVMSGHAHGGQFRLPTGDGLFAPSQGWFPKYTEGVHVMNDTHLVISRGLGHSSFPFRINNAPELVFITLYQGNT